MGSIPPPLSPPNTSAYNSYSTTMLTGPPYPFNDHSPPMMYQFNSMGPIATYNNNNNNAVVGGFPDSYDCNTPPNTVLFDGSSPTATTGLPCEVSTGDPVKRKRGRPRKDINSSASSGGLIFHGDSNGGGISGSDPLSSKRQRGRPIGSGKKQIGIGGAGFTPHVINVNAGEDIAAKLTAFAQQGSRAICILSAHGAVTDVKLRQPLMSGDRAVVYEGPHEIILLSGSFLELSENNGNHFNGGLSVSMAGPDGRVSGGAVSGKLTAASPVQVVVGSFMLEGKKSTSNTLSGPSSATPNHYNESITSFGATATISPQSQGPSSDSSDENGVYINNQLNQGPAFYNNGYQPMQHSMGMPIYYNHMARPEQTLTNLLQGNHQDSF